MSPNAPEGGYAFDVTHQPDINSAINNVADGLAYFTAYFGQHTDVLGGGGRTALHAVQGWFGHGTSGPEGILGARDAELEDPANDIPRAWEAFCAAWGDFMDEATGTVYGLAGRMADTADQYQQSDQAASKILEPFADGQAKLAGPTTPVTPGATTTEVGEKNRFAWLTRRDPYDPPGPGEDPPAATNPAGTSDAPYDPAGPGEAPPAPGTPGSTS